MCKATCCCCKIIIANIVFYLLEAIACTTIAGMTYFEDSPFLTHTCTFIWIAIVTIGATDVVSFFLTTFSQGVILISLVGHCLNILVRIFAFVTFETIIHSDDANAVGLNTTCSLSDHYVHMKGMIFTICVLSIYPIGMTCVIIRLYRAKDIFIENYV